MAKGNVGSLLVFDPAKIDFADEEKVKAAAGDAVVGIVTERGMPLRNPEPVDLSITSIGAIFPAWLADYLTKVVVKGKSSSQVPVQEVMTPAAKLMTVTPNHSVLDVMTMMIDNNFRHVPVVS